MRMMMKADMMPIRAEPRRKILIVMLSCVVDWNSSVHHQRNENSLLIEFNPTRTSVFKIVWCYSGTFYFILFCLNKHSRFLSLCFERQLNSGSDQACSFLNLINTNSAALNMLYIVLKQLKRCRLSVDNFPLQSIDMLKRNKTVHVFLSEK